mgnify:CR=1 FL=1
MVKNITSKGTLNAKDKSEKSGANGTNYASEIQNAGTLVTVIKLIIIY